MEEASPETVEEPGGATAGERNQREKVERAPIWLMRQVERYMNASPLPFCDSLLCWSAKHFYN